MILQYAGFFIAKEFNAFYRKNLTAGLKGLSVTFYLTTHSGYNSDYAREIDDIRKAEVAIDSVEDIKIFF